MKLRLEKLRTDAHLTQQQLAEMCGVKQSVISDIENGKVKYPRMDTLVALSHAFGIKIDEMISYKD